MNNDTTSTSTPTSIVIGGILLITALPGMVSNSLVLTVLGLKGFLSAQSPPVYKFLFVLLSANTLSLLCTLGYTAPAVIFQKVFNEILPLVIGCIIVGCFVIDCLVMIMVAVNRLVAVTWPTAIDDIYSQRNSSVMAIFSIVFAIAWTLIGQIVVPCCKLEVIPMVYGAGWVGTSTNLQESVMELPFNVITSVIIIVCYGKVLWISHKTGKTVQASTTSKRQIFEKERKARLVKQCILISIFWMILWISFNVYGAVMQHSTTRLEPYALITFVGTIHASMNSFVMIHYNATLKRRARELFGLAILGDGGAATTVAPFQGRSTVSLAMKERGELSTHRSFNNRIDPPNVIVEDEFI